MTDIIHVRRDTEDGEVIITIESLYKTFGDNVVLNGVDIGDAYRGEVFVVRVVSFGYTKLTTL